MAELDRRSALRLLGGAPLAVGFGLSAATVQTAHAQATKAVAAAARGQAFKPKFFTPHEWQTVRVLADLIIPRDARSGGANDAGVPEFMDFVMLDPVEEPRTREWRQTSMRGGLAWLDQECRDRFGKDFLTAGDTERTQVLDDIAYRTKEGAPKVQRPELRAGQSFFESFRDLTSSGFWSSKTGVDDLGYVGNQPFPWNGPPAEVLKKLGLDGGNA
jgi:gluconate 2-dehydrogenase gamma chain